jgi:ATP-dependent exoDNAse (exonuclease V) beta subunit
VTRPADWREREACLDPAVSCIVQAPAGSGKTELLTQRMLRLLSRVDHPEEVVAITFTRKAAAEMSHRLLLQLRAACESAGTLEPYQQTSRELAQAVLRRDEERGWDLLEQPGRLRIRTIDGLCGEIARQLPLLSGLGGGQQIAEDAEALHRLAAVRTMAAIDNSSDDLQADVARMLDRYDNQYDRLVELLTGMLDHREQWLGHILDVQDGTGFDREGLERALRFLIEAELQAAGNLLTAELVSGLPPLLRYALGNLPADADNLGALLAACGGQDCRQLNLPVSADALPHWITLIDRLLTADGKKWRSGADRSAGFLPPSQSKGEEKSRRAEYKEKMQALLRLHSGDDRLRDQFNVIRTLPRPEYDEEAWDSLESLLRILLRAAQEWKLVMAESGKADFSEIASRAIQALGPEGEPTNLALRLDYRIRHLLVDEFQDTSLGQIRLLERLTAGWCADDGRTLFLVGDPMQSIYRFRKAEVSLFTDAFEGLLFQHIDLKPLRLAVNFRSNQPVIDWVNRVFPQVMPARTDPVLGAIPYHSSASRPSAGHAGEVAVHLLPERDDAREAVQVTDLIRKLPSGESCAVLVRSRSHAQAILSLFDRLKESEPCFRYQAIRFNPLADTPVVQDLVALTLALLQPADRLAWLTVLRAPFAGLDLADLDFLAGGGGNSVILDAIADHETKPLTGGGRRRMRRIAPLLLDAASRRGRDSTRSLVERVWLHLGGPACMRNGGELDDVETYLNLLEALEAEGEPIDRETLALRMKDLHAEADANADGRLQVMTMYAAKGLEFDHVILPGLNREPSGDSGKLLHWFELVDARSIVLSPMRSTAEKLDRSGDLIRYVSGVEKRRQVLENGRLLYVAATRAIKSLHLLAGLGTMASGEANARPAALMGVLWPAIRAEHPTGSGPLDGAPAEAAETGESPLPQLHRRLDADWELPPPPPPVRHDVKAEPVTDDSIEFRWAGERARLTGELVHRILQRVAEGGSGRWLNRRGRAALETWCRCQLAAAGVHAGAADGVLRRVADAVDTCLASERGRWLLDDHSEAHCEFEITAMLDGAPRKMVLDRTFVADGVRWIVDYKTSSHGGGDLEGFLRSEAERYRNQLVRYREAMALTEARPIRTALYFPLLDRFVET